MIAVRTLIREPAGFQPITDSTKIPDPDYIEGALELTIGGKQLCGEDQWDLVDQLLCYFVTLLADMDSHNTATFYFPDQPLQVICTVIRESPEKIVSLQIGEKSSPAISLSELKNCVFREAQRALTLLQKITGSSYESPLKEIRRLL